MHEDESSITNKFEQDVQKKEKERRKKTKEIHR